MKNSGETGSAATATDKHPRRQKSREVSSRFLDPISPEQPVATDHYKKHRSGFIRGLWPHSSSKSRNENSPATSTLDDHLQHERRKDRTDDSIFLTKQRSCSEFSRFESDSKSNKKSGSKENHKPLFGGSMRYTGKFGLPGRSSTSSNSSSPSNSELIMDINHGLILPRRFSVDENSLGGRSYSQRDSFSDNSECSTDYLASPFNKRSFPAASYMAPTVSSRKSGIEVSSKYMSDPPKNKSALKHAMKKANSLKWAVSPGRSESPPGLTSSSSFSSSKPHSSPSKITAKPPTSPSRTKNFLHMGLDLIKGKKKGSTSGCLSPLGPCSITGMAESIHQLRMMHNRFLQWRFSNARAEVVNASIANQTERNLIYAWDSIGKLQQSVVQKRLQLEKEKLEMKLNFILRSQTNLLEAWRDMEWQHISALSTTKDGLHGVLCKVPLVDGAKVESLSTSVALGHASDAIASIESMLSSFSSTTEETVGTLSELVEVALEEKSILEECLEHFRLISTLEIQERSLRCSIIELRSLQHRQQQHHQQQQHEIQA